jgi:hypothetical protein
VASTASTELARSVDGLEDPEDADEQVRHATAEPVRRAPILPDTDVVHVYHLCYFLDIWVFSSRKLHRRP